MQRFEYENGGDLLIAAVCLLEVSSRGLLETELLKILGNEDAIKIGGYGAEGGDKGIFKSYGGGGSDISAEQILYCNC